MITSTFISALLDKMAFVGKQALIKRTQPDFIIHEKTDLSLVTNVDFWANEELVTFIRGHFPNHVIIGEESEAKTYPQNASYIWYIDPIDGTKAFTQGLDHFFILVGLAIDGIPEYGFFYKPAEDLCIFTRAEKTVEMTSNGFVVGIPELNWKTEGSLVLKKTSATQKMELQEIFGQQKEPYIYDMVSMLGPIFGKSNGYIGFRRTYFWDICAPAAIMRHLGYTHVYVDYEGKEMNMNTGEVKCRAYYSLPKDAPTALIKWFDKQIPDVILSNDD